MELKGSKTEKNLMAAFAGESQARNKYTYFADVAKEEGFEPVAEVFLETANNERAHAKREFDFLKGIGDTNANLKAAAEGEHYERTEMYPEFARIAREEGFNEIAAFFKGVAEIEERHEKRYLALLNDVQKKKAAKKDKAAVWKCRSCGWISRDVAAPGECPTCKMPQSSFEESAGPLY
ncbi:MAG: ferritin family protein [bacterium]|nr:ferritin family protein [bacterium]